MDEVNNDRVNRIIKGLPISQKNVKGEVLIVRPGKEIGEARNKIIVIEEIHPKHIISIIDCLGVVAVFGGQTSHTATVCRELNKPCLVGVKRAFYELRNKDYIEIDSLNNQIKIIKPNNG